MRLLNFILLSLTAISLVACSNDGNEENGSVGPTNLTVTGKVTGASGQLATLEAMSPNGAIKVAETTVSDDAFNIQANIPGLGIYQLRIGSSPENVLLLTAQENDKIQIVGDLKTFAFESKITGVDWGKDYSTYMKLVADFSRGQQELMSLQGQVKQEDLVKRYLELKAPVDAFAREKINANPASSFNLVLSNALTPNQGFVDYPKENVEALRKMADAYEKEHSTSPFTRSLQEQVVQIESGYKEYEIIKSGKQPAPEIIMLSPEDKEIRLSSLKGKVVLIDFWASWCGPCRKENPNVVKLYNKYKSKGFTVYSVSLDTNREQWKAAIAADGLIWPNHVSDLTGWKTYVTTLYGFQSIPHTVLVGKDGNIIAVGLREHALEQKLAEIFN